MSADCHFESTTERLRALLRGDETIDSVVTIVCDLSTNIGLFSRYNWYDWDDWHYDIMFLILACIDKTEAHADMKIMAFAGCISRVFNSTIMQSCFHENDCYFKHDVPSEDFMRAIINWYNLDLNDMFCAVHCSYNWKNNEFYERRAYSIKFFQLLVNIGFDVNYLMDGEYSVLMMCLDDPAFHDYAKILLEHGADIYLAAPHEQERIVDIHADTIDKLLQTEDKKFAAVQGLTTRMAKHTHFGEYNLINVILGFADFRLIK